MKIGFIGGWGHNYTAAFVNDGKATAAVAHDGRDAEACQRLAARLASCPPTTTSASEGSRSGPGRPTARVAWPLQSGTIRT